jgi:recombination protein RecT
VNRSGRATVWTGAVFQGDEFDYALGDNPFVKHRPGDEDDPTKLTHVYACGSVNNATRTVIEVWRMSKVWKHRDKVNKVGSNHYSFAHPEMYARKVPLLQVLKYMPSSVELTNAVGLSEASDAGEGYIVEGDFVTAAGTSAGIDPETGETSAPAPAPASEPGPTYAVCIERLKKTTDPQIAGIVLEDAALLPADQYEQVTAFFKQKFTPGAKP